MAKKVVETLKAPDGRYIWQIGEVDQIGLIGCMFVDKASGHWGRDRKGNGEIKYTGEFFPTQKAAIAAGRKQIT